MSWLRSARLCSPTRVGKRGGEAWACGGLLRSGGLMIGDNTLLFGAMTGQARQKTSQAAIQAMRDFNKTMASSDQLEGILIPTDEGMTVAQKH